jgi:hypothetical protein
MGADDSVILIDVIVPPRKHVIWHSLKYCQFSGHRHKLGAFALEF